MPKRVMVALISLALMSEAPLFGQSLAKQDSSTIAAGEDTLKKLQLPAELFKQLDKPSQEIASAMANISKLLQGNIDDIKNAEAEYDRVASAIEAAAKLGGPDGEFIKRLDEMIRLANEESIKARNAGWADYEKQFSSYAKDYETAKTKLDETHNSSFRIIRQIRQEKERFVMGMKLNNFEQAKANIGEGLKLFAQLDGQLKGLRDALPKPPTGVSQ